jgi:hypothetical protein
MEIRICPECQESSGLREVIYGLPESAPDESIFATGGCCISEKDPTVICRHCGWEGEFVNNIGILGFI